MEPFSCLSNAIIEQAAKDYRTAARKLKKDPENITAQTTIREVERFFRSSWFSVLSDADGTMILRLLRKEVAA